MGHNGTARDQLDPLLELAHGNPILEFRKQRANTAFFSKWGLFVSKLFGFSFNKLGSSVVQISGDCVSFWYIFKTLCHPGPVEFHSFSYSAFLRLCATPDLSNFTVFHTRHF